MKQNQQLVVLKYFINSIKSIMNIASSVNNAQVNIFYNQVFCILILTINQLTL